MVSSGPKMLTSRRTALLHEPDQVPDDWVLTEDQVPESRPHDLVSDRIQDLLRAWAERMQRNVTIGRNLAVRWLEERPSIGVDPDVYILDPGPPDADDEMLSLKIWEPGHQPPLLAVEIVSQSRADKDYSVSPLKYAACGATELWVLDPKLCGPRKNGGPFRIQMWRPNEHGSERLYAGDGPVFSPAVGGWLFAVKEGRSFAIADDQEGTSWWMTVEETERAAKEEALRRAAEERAAKEAERAAKEAERAAKEAALERIATLEALIAGGKLIPH